MSTEADNARKWDGAGRPHCEVWYLPRDQAIEREHHGVE